MSGDTDPSETLDELRTGLSSVESTLAPLLERKWTETTGALGTLERAKMDVLVSYAINDLLWVYLKMKGVDPSTHDVSAELERIRTYYAKVKAVEEPEQRRTTQIDKAAAGRIISHSIPASQRLADQGTASTSAAAIARKQAEAAVGEQSGAAGRTSNRYKFIAKDDETEKVTGGANASDDESGAEEEEGEEEEGEGGDEADDLLNDLQEQFQAKQQQGNEGSRDRRKRKRAEDLGKK